MGIIKQHIFITLPVKKMVMGLLRGQSWKLGLLGRTRPCFEEGPTRDDGKHWLAQESKFLGLGLWGRKTERTKPRAWFVGTRGLGLLVNYGSYGTPARIRYTREDGQRIAPPSARSLLLGGYPPSISGAQPRPSWTAAFSHSFSPWSPFPLISLLPVASTIQGEFRWLGVWSQSINRIAEWTAICNCELPWSAPNKRRRRKIQSESQYVRTDCN